MAGGGRPGGGAAPPPVFPRVGFDLQRPVPFHVWNAGAAAAITFAAPLQFDAEAFAATDGQPHFGHGGRPQMMAAIAGIDPGLYEAALMDGAGRLRRIWHVTVPGMQSAIVVVLILSIGSMLGGGLVGSNFEQSLLLGNPVNADRSQIIQTYAFSVGLAQGRFAFATAVDLIQSIISVILVCSANFVSRRLSGIGLY